MQLTTQYLFLAKDKYTPSYVTEDSGIEFATTPILSPSGFGGGNGSPYKRRRETEVESQTSLEDDNPFTKRNFERQNNISQMSAHKEEEVVVKVSFVYLGILVTIKA